MRNVGVGKDDVQVTAGEFVCSPDAWKEEERRAEALLKMSIQPRHHVYGVQSG